MSHRKRSWPQILCTLWLCDSCCAHRRFCLRRLPDHAVRLLHAGKEAAATVVSGVSKRAGLSSPNYLKLVMDGERNLTHEMARRFATAMRLSDDEASYFCILVNLTHTDSTEGA